MKVTPVRTAPEFCTVWKTFVGWALPMRLAQLGRNNWQEILKVSSPHRLPSSLCQIQLIFFRNTSVCFSPSKQRVGNKCIVSQGRMKVPQAIATPVFCMVCDTCCVALPISPQIGRIDFIGMATTPATQFLVPNSAHFLSQYFRLPQSG